MGAGSQLTTCCRRTLTFKLVLVLRRSSKEWLNQMQLYVFLSLWHTCRPNQVQNYLDCLGTNQGPKSWQHMCTLWLWWQTIHEQNPNWHTQFDTTYIIFKNVENFTPKLIKFNIKKFEGKIKIMMEYLGTCNFSKWNPQYLIN
jgi:hypothetical protein